jgi:arginyl-tRNA synthetase
MRESALAKARKDASSLLVAACASLGAGSVAALEVEKKLSFPKPEFGDLASPIAFDLARELKKAPQKIAEELCAAVSGRLEGTLFDTVKAVGGYVNFSYSPKRLAEAVLEDVYGGGTCYGRVSLGNGRKAMVEFPSVNPNKPWHVGHLRNALLGDSVANVLEFAGFDVIRSDYINNLGLQCAQSVWSFENVDSNVEGKADQWIGKQYAQAAKRFEEPGVETEVRRIMKEMEEGKTREARVARELEEKCVAAQYETSFKLGIFHDVMVWETDLVDSGMLEKALDKARATGLVEVEKEGKNAGCLVARLGHLPEFKGMENPDKILVRSDGVTAYTGKDVAFHLWKFGLVDYPMKFREFLKQPNGETVYISDSSEKGKEMHWSVDLIINVVGVEQKFPQQVVRLILKAMGFEKASENYFHLSYEHATLEGEKLSGRKGNWLGFTADEVIEKAVEEAETQIREKFKDMSDSERKGISEAVGIGAIKFGFLKFAPETKMVFKFEEALSFEGDSAPYVQYSHARACRILEKSGVDENSLTSASSALSHPEEKKLLLLIASFSDVVENSAKSHSPHGICTYSLDLASQFSKFYDACPVLKAEREEERKSRLALVKAYKIVLGNALALLGIKAPERM